MDEKLDAFEAEVEEIMKDYDDADVEFVNQYLNKNLTKWVKGISRDGEDQSIHIPYMDANNLYGWAMSQPLPIRDFKWMSGEELEKWRNYGCILEVDLEYPEELHDKHNEYPLAPERMEVNKVDMLIPNLNNKEKYIIHHKSIKQCLNQGLKLTKVHRGVKFIEEPWLKKYIKTQYGPAYQRYYGLREGFL